MWATGKPVAVSGIVISGRRGCRQLHPGEHDCIHDGDDLAAAFDVTATGVNKVYDGNTTATVTLTDDKVPGDAVTDAYTTATFAGQEVEPAKAVSVSGVSISGADAANLACRTPRPRPRRISRSGR